MDDSGRVALVLSGIDDDVDPPDILVVLVADEPGFQPLRIESDSGRATLDY